MKKSLLLSVLFFLISFNLFAKEINSIDFIILDTSYLSIPICEGESIVLNGTVYEETGTYTEVIPGGSYDGTDSVIILSLEVLENDTTELFFEICPGEPSPLSGNICENNTWDTLFHYDNVSFVNQNGCDSIVFATVAVAPYGYGYAEVYLQAGEVFNGQIYMEPGCYGHTDTSFFEGECPIIFSVTVCVSPNSTTELEKEINLQLFPNPFSELLSIEFEMPKSADEIY